MTAAVTVASLQLDALKEAFPGSTLEALPGGVELVAVPEVPLVSGWSKSTTAVWFLIPVGFPSATPDCFFADIDLRLANGAQPASSGIQEIPNAGKGARLWFSWHVNGWRPARDTLLTYMRVIRDRLDRAQ